MALQSSVHCILFRVVEIYVDQGQEITVCGNRIYRTSVCQLYYLDSGLVPASREKLVCYTPLGCVEHTTHIPHYLYRSLAEDGCSPFQSITSVSIQTFFNVSTDIISTAPCPA